MQKLIDAISNIGRAFFYVPETDTILKHIEEFGEFHELLPYLYAKQTADKIFAERIEVSNILSDKFSDFKKNIEYLNEQLNSKNIIDKISLLEDEIKWFVESGEYCEYDIARLICELSTTEYHTAQKFKVKACANNDDTIEVVKHTQVFDNLYEAINKYKQYGHNVFVRIEARVLIPACKYMSSVTAFLIKRDGELLIFTGHIIDPLKNNIDLYFLTSDEVKAYLDNIKKTGETTIRKSGTDFELLDMPGLGKYLHTLQSESKSKVSMKECGLLAYLKYLKTKASSEDIDEIVFGYDEDNKLDTIKSLYQYKQEMFNSRRLMYMFYGSLAFDYLMPEDFKPVEIRKYVGTMSEFKDWELTELTTRLLKIGSELYANNRSNLSLTRDDIMALVWHNKNIVNDIIKYSSLHKTGRVSTLNPDNTFTDLTENLDWSWNSKTNAVAGKLDSIFDAIQKDPRIYFIDANTEEISGSKIHELSIYKAKTITDDNGNLAYIDISQRYGGIDIFLTPHELAENVGSWNKRNFKCTRHYLELRSWQDFCRVFRCSKKMLPLILQQVVSTKPELQGYTFSMPYFAHFTISIYLYTPLEVK